MTQKRPDVPAGFPTFLLEGYARFRGDVMPAAREQYLQLAKEGQSPAVMMIACCDSRAAPETIFGTAPGEMFVARNVANLVPPYKPTGEYHSASAALEFAVQALKVQHIVVLGHGRCGGIKAALDPSSEPLSPGDFIGKWLEMLGPVSEEVGKYAHLTQGERQTMLERISVRRSIENLKTFPCVQILHEKGRLQLHGAWFDIAKGELWIMDEQRGDFEPVEELYPTTRA